MRVVMKKILIVCLLILVAGSAFALDFTTEAGVSTMLGTQLGVETGSNNIRMYGLFFDYMMTIGEGEGVEFTFGARLDTCTQDLMLSNFGLSVVAGVGANFNITDSFSAYIMPGFGEYFVTGYKEKVTPKGTDVQICFLGLAAMGGLRYRIGGGNFLVTLSGTFMYPFDVLTLKKEGRGNILSTIGLGMGVRF